MIKIWEWDKKPRTMLRYINMGDIFCFKFDDYTYCFGRIMAKVQFHIAEIFDYVSNEPVITEVDICNAGRFMVIPLDTYSLFDRKSERARKPDWRIIGHQENYIPENVEGIYFAWGIGMGRRKSDVFGNTVPISEDEWRALPKLSPQGEYRVRQIIEEELGKVEYRR